MKKDNDYITKQAIEQEKVLGFKGLYHECKTACEELGMPDLLESNVSKQQIKQLCMEKSRTECKQKMLVYPLDIGFHPYLIRCSPKK